MKAVSKLFLIGIYLSFSSSIFFAQNPATDNDPMHSNEITEKNTLDTAGTNLRARINSLSAISSNNTALTAEETGNAWSAADLTSFAYRTGSTAIGTSAATARFRLDYPQAFVWMGFEMNNIYDNGTVYKGKIQMSSDGFLFRNFSSSTLGNVAFSFRSSGDSKLLTLLSDGKVGIGTDAPTYKLHVNGDIYSTGGWVRVAGTRGLYFQDYGGGFYMSDTYWIKTYNERALYLGQGKLRTDGELQVGLDGSKFIVNAEGKVGIGFTAPTYALSVNGTISSKEIIVNTTGADFVFEEGYELKSLDEVENFIKENKHLPDVPSADEMQENGTSLGEMQTKLLQKIEELTLYVIELKKENKEIKEQNKQLSSKLNSLIK